MAGADQKVAFVTGAGSGIGRATAEIFLQRGYRTILVDRNEAAGREAEEQLRASGECRFVQCDVADEESVVGAVARTVELYGRLDAAFNAAGIDGELGKGTADASVDIWNRIVAVNLTGTWFCMRHQIRQMLANGGGSIVNCASVAGLVGAPFMSGYVATKHGIVGLTRAAALEYARQNIRVNAVCPGMIDTPMSRAGLTPDLANMLIAESPIGRFGQPEEVGAVVVGLCDVSFVTGQALAVDGGWTAR